MLKHIHHTRRTRFSADDFVRQFKAAFAPQATRAPREPLVRCRARPAISAARRRRRHDAFRRSGALARRLGTRLRRAPRSNRSTRYAARRTVRRDAGCHDGETGAGDARRLTRCLGCLGGAP